MKLSDNAKRWVYALAALAVFLIFFFGVKRAVAQAATTLPTATAAGTDWWPIVLILIVAGVIGVAIWYRRKNPAGFATLETTALTDLKAVGEKIVTAIRDHTAAVAPATAAAPAPAAPVGKNGVAGVMTLTVTGDSKTDLAAFMAAYYS